MGQTPRRVLEELTAVPLREFTARRDALAADLRRAGRAGEARAVATLRKPPATLWATNQLHRADPGRLAAFLGAVEQVRRTQLRDPRGAAGAIRAQREHLDALVSGARDAMAAAGFRPSPPALRRISGTLLGAAVDRRLADDLRHGRLTEELAAPGFEALAGPAATETGRAAARSSTTGSRARRLRKTRT